MKAMLCALLRDRRGATAVEYGLIASLVVLAMVVSFNNLASASSAMWNNVQNKNATAHGS